MKTAFITGATSGIGEEFAKRFARKGYRLILTGRREDRLEKLSEKLKVPCRIIVCDLSKEEGARELLHEVKDERIDIFINNAGFGTCGMFSETDMDKEISMIMVNDLSMHILFKGILKKMMLVNHGRILNVGSSAGLLPGGPYMATYYASKAYVVSLTRAVATELKNAKSRVKVSVLCPGPVDTEFNENADVQFGLKGITVEKCVDDALRGMRCGRTVIVPTLLMKLATSAQKFAPGRFVLRMTGRQQKKKL